MIRLALLLALAAPAAAETVLAARTIRPQMVIGPADIALHPSGVPGAFARAEEVLGQEARVVLYAGRPIRPGDIGPPALVERNQTVTLNFSSGALSIRTEGRALDRGGLGERIRVMNLSSRATLFGEVRSDGTIEISR